MSLKSKIAQWIKSNNVITKSVTITADNITLSSLPASFDNERLDGDRYVNGKCVRTVGEYKAALEESYWTDAYR